MRIPPNLLPALVDPGDDFYFEEIPVLGADVSELMGEGREGSLSCHGLWNQAVIEP